MNLTDNLERIGAKDELQSILAGYNPLLAQQWHPTKNGILKPEDVIAGTPKKVWWQCSTGHEWVASVSDRNRGNGCSYCSKEKRTKPYINLPGN